MILAIEETSILWLVDNMMSTFQSILQGIFIEETFILVREFLLKESFQGGVAGKTIHFFSKERDVLFKNTCLKLSRDYATLVKISQFPHPLLKQEKGHSTTQIEWEKPFELHDEVKSSKFSQTQMINLVFGQYKDIPYVSWLKTLLKPCYSLHFQFFC